MDNKNYVAAPEPLDSSTAARILFGDKTYEYGKGNIDLNNRPIVKNGNGVSTVFSMSFQPSEGQFAGKEVLIPRVSDDGNILTPEQAIDTFYRTGRYLGVFNTAKEANEYAEQLHEKQEEQYVKRL